MKNSVISSIQGHDDTLLKDQFEEAETAPETIEIQTTELLENDMQHRIWRQFIRKNNGTRTDVKAVTDTICFQKPYGVSSIMKNSELEENNPLAKTDGMKESKRFVVSYGEVVDGFHGGDEGRKPIFSDQQVVSNWFASSHSSEVTSVADFKISEKGTNTAMTNDC